MGYEAKIIVGVKKTSMDETNISVDTLTWFDVIAEFDIRKYGLNSNIGKLIKKQLIKDPIVYWFGSDCHTKQFEDIYGDCFDPIPVKEVYEALREDSYGGYNRIGWAMDMVKSFVKNPSSDKIEVIFYRY